MNKQKAIEIVDKMFDYRLNDPHWTFNPAYLNSCMKQFIDALCDEPTQEPEKKYLRHVLYFHYKKHGLNWFDVAEAAKAHVLSVLPKSPGEYDCNEVFLLYDDGYNDCLEAVKKAVSEA